MAAAMGPLPKGLFRLQTVTNRIVDPAVVPVFDQDGDVITLLSALKVSSSVSISGCDLEIGVRVVVVLAGTVNDGDPVQATCRVSRLS